MPTESLAAVVVAEQLAYGVLLTAECLRENDVAAAAKALFANRKNFTKLERLLRQRWEETDPEGAATFFTDYFAGQYE